MCCSICRTSTFSLQPVTEVNFPAVTLCPQLTDTGEWVRAVLNNLEYDTDIVTAFGSFLNKSAEPHMTSIKKWAKYFTERKLSILRFEDNIFRVDAYSESQVKHMKKILYGTLQCAEKRQK